MEKLGTSVMNALAMMFAWCLLWGARCAWMAQASPGFLGLNVLSISARILLALAFSTVAVFVTIYLDKIADGMKANTKDPSAFWVGKPPAVAGGQLQARLMPN